jgi:hypothetical protein
MSNRENIRKRFQDLITSERKSKYSRSNKFDNDLFDGSNNNSTSSGSSNILIDNGNDSNNPINVSNNNPDNSRITIKRWTPNKFEGNCKYL